MIRILLLDSQLMEEHRLRQDSRRAGLSLIYECAIDSASLISKLAGGPAALVAFVGGGGAFSLEESAEASAATGVPLVLIGGDSEAEREALEQMRGRYAVSVRRGRISWLPVLLERVVRERKAALGGSADKPEQLSSDAPRTAEQLQQVQKLAIVGRLAGSIAHEINNPLESITNLVYLISSDEELPGRLRPYLELAQGELERVAQISKQTLSFYRETQAPVRVELSALWEEVAVLYGRRLHEKGIELIRRYESEEPLMLLPGEMRQVYANLLANAIEATEPGGRIVVRIHKVREATGARGAFVAGVRVVVADSGCGIAGSALAQLGHPFYTTKGQGGTGLGLWVSRAIVGRQGGQLRMRSSVAPQRHGTTFTIFMPLKPRQRLVELRPLSTQKADPEATQPDGGWRLLASSH